VQQSTHTSEDQALTRGRGYLASVQPIRDGGLATRDPVCA
jgi:hypothetical protein